MTRKTLRISLVMAAAVVSLGIVGGIAPSIVEAKTPPVYSIGKEQLALKGYDPVAYFVAGKPMKGDAQFKAVHNGATWYFSSTGNRDLFLAEPAKYAPQYGGYCAWAVSEGYTAPADPNVWKIVANKLYVNYNASVGSNWEKDTARNISRADKNWPKVLEK
jgi:YHS domain-containing protein